MKHVFCRQCRSKLSPYFPTHECSPPPNQTPSSHTDCRDEPVGVIPGTQTPVSPPIKRPLKPSTVKLLQLKLTKPDNVRNPSKMRHPCTEESHDIHSHSHNDDTAVTKRQKCVHHCVRSAIQSILDTSYRTPVLAIDTETTGLRGAVVQIALVYISADGSRESVFTGLAHPPAGFKMEAAAERVHGISSARLKQEAVDDAHEFFHEVFLRIQDARHQGLRVVAHNATFDIARLNDTFKGHGLPHRIGADEVFCTMRAGRQRCNLRTVKGAPRCPKNSELYEILVSDALGRGPEGYALPQFAIDLATLTSPDSSSQLHDAAVDARITAHAWLEGRRKGWWI